MIKNLWNKLTTPSKDFKFEALRTIVAVAISLVIAAIIIFMVSEEPLYALQKLFLGPLESGRRFANVIELAIPLTFTGLAVTIMFKANQFNMISEGVFYVGGVIASIVAIRMPLPPYVHPSVAILISGVLGGFIAMIPSLLYLKWKASELVSSLMMNFILFNLGLFVINNFYRDISAGAMASEPFLKTAILTNLVPGTRIHWGVLLAVAATILVHLFLNKTKWGYDLKLTGENTDFAKYSGIKTKRVIIYSQFIGGFLAAMGGAIEALGMYDRFKWQDLTNYGFDGIIVAILAKEKPIYVPFAALFLAYLRIGADRMGSATDVTYEIISIIQGIIIMFVAAKSFMARYKQRMIVKEAKENE